MTGNEQSQLRFDISEKVTFHREQPGINTLLSLDLTPEVRIEDLGANVKIQGAIRLNGTYLGRQSENPEQLAEVSELDEELAGEEIQYIIPVEITLPSERARRLEDITAEIQSFDYELLSSHELGIEAILVIDGLDLRPSENAANASFGEQRKEQALIKGHDDVEGPSYEMPFGFNPSSFERSEQESSAEYSLQEELQSDATADVEADASEDSLGADDSLEQVAEQAIDESDTLSGESAPPESDEEGAAEDDDALYRTEFETEVDTSPDTNQGTKIHFHKQVEKKAPQSDSISLNELLGDASTQPDNAPDESSATAPITEEEVDETVAGTDEEQEESKEKNAGIEWMKEKLGGGEDRFHRLKMVIVQKDDTLEGIADRYDLSSVELLQVNKLTTGELEQGQIVYIPLRDS